MVDRALVLCALLLTACPREPPSADAGPDGGDTCLAFDGVRSATVLGTGMPHPVPLTALARADNQFCVDSHTFRLGRLDAAGGGQVRFDDGGMFVEADTGGVYALFDDGTPAQRVSQPLYFARAVVSPMLTWPRLCQEVHRLTPTIWACDGVLFNGTNALAEDGTHRWLRRFDGLLLAARADGITEVAATQLGTDAGALFAPMTGIEAWSSDETGLSLATDAGFFECLWSQTTCSSLGPRFGTGDVPLEQQSLSAFLRRDGRTVFSVVPGASPFCEARLDVQKCSKAILGAIVASNATSGWAGSTIFDTTGAVGVVEVRWDGGWNESTGAFVGPPDFVLKGGVRAQTPSRVIYSRGRQFLFWRWDAPGEAFKVVEVPDAGGLPTNAGSSDGFFWISVGGPDPRTQIFLGD